MELSGRMQEPWTPAESNRTVYPSRDGIPQRGSLGEVNPVKVGLNADVAVAGNLRQQGVDSTVEGLRFCQ